MSSISEWALWVGVLVYAHDVGGASATGVVSLSLLASAMIVTPVAGTLADGLHPNDVLVGAYSVQAVALLAAATVSTTTSSLVGVVVPAAVMTAAISFVPPTMAVVMPSLVVSPAELTAGNLVAGYCDSAAVLLGPLLASGILALTGSAAVLWTCAGLTGASTLAIVRLHRADPPAVFRHGHDGSPTNPPRLAMLRHGIREIARRRGICALLIVLAAEHLLIGGLDVIYIVFAIDELHLSDATPGLFGAAFGFGAIVGGIASTALVSRTPLARWVLGAVAVIISAVVALAGAPMFVTALCLFPVMGLGRSVLDLSGRILLQRAAPQEALATTFAVLEALSLVCGALGVVVVQALIDLSGARAALVGVGVTLAIVIAGTAPALRHIDDLADAPVVEIRLLRRLAVFSALPGPELEGVARAGRHEHAPAGATIITEGEAGDRYYAIARGDVEVSVGQNAVRFMRGGDGFGEIALLADRPRTATVRAVTDVELLTIDRAAFLTVVGGHRPTNRAAWGLIRAMEPRVDEEVG